MPASALERAAVDAVAPADAIAEAIVRLIRGGDAPGARVAAGDRTPSEAGAALTTIVPTAATH
jgi:hypothetical protein